MAALFIAQGLGMDLSLSQQLLIVVTSVIASVGAAGIPEAGLVTMTLVFHSVHLPPEYIALLLPVDWFLDRCRTAINVMGDMNVACLLDGKTPAAAETPAVAAA
jgi:Na+/H+-dicarboxylate symporter